MKKLFIMIIGLTLITVLSMNTFAVEIYSDKADDYIPFEQISENINQDIDIMVDYVGYPSVSSYKTAIQQSLDQADSPGLFTWWSGYRLHDLAKTGKILDLTNEWEDYYTKSGLNPQLANAFTVDGKIYGAPYTVLYHAVFYNKAIFNKYDLEIPKTFDEFLDVCETLKSKGVTPIGLKSDPWASFLWFQALIGSYSPDLYTNLMDGNIPYTDEKVEDAMKVWQSMINKGYFAEPQDYNTVIKQFVKGDVAMIYDNTLMTTSFGNDYGLTAEDDYSIFQIPSMKKSNKPIIFYEAAPLVVSSASSQKSDALKVLRELYNVNNQQALANYTNSAALLEGVNIENETSGKVSEMANSGDYLLKIRYYEATPSDIVDTATNSLWKFFYDPTDSSLENTLNTIQEKADNIFSK